MHRAIAELLEYSGGLIARRDYPELARQMEHAVRCGELVSILPGVYAVPEVARDWRIRARAVALWSPDAVLIGEAAAALTFWPELVPGRIDVASCRARFARPGFAFTRHCVPADCVTQLAGQRIATPAATALDLIPAHGGDVIDRALRSRQTTLDDLHRAFGLTAHRLGNPERRLMLLDSRGNPWSAAERLAHRHLRAAGITRWHANVPIVCGGRKYFQDIAMDDCPVTLEIDGKVHLRPQMFESDRRRGNDLLLAGRQVLHYTWLMLTEEPRCFVATTQRAIDLFA